MAYGVEASQDRLPFQLKLWMDRVFALASDVKTYAASTIKRKKCELERNLAENALCQVHPDQCIFHLKWSSSMRGYQNHNLGTS